MEIVSDRFLSFERPDLLYALAKANESLINAESYTDDDLRQIVILVYEGLPTPPRTPRFTSSDDFTVFDRSPEATTSTKLLFKKSTE